MKCQTSDSHTPDATTQPVPQLSDKTMVWVDFMGDPLTSRDELAATEIIHDIVEESSLA